ncbi:MAG TPA: tRNA lysidine(34) synthetase TilS [Gammaproteobacteria bacterium]|nr:tRNA lysidine(34) synthetase TilS [Gammaproteobacteria bacterium]
MLTKLQALIQDYGFERNYWLAYSGGLDSQVLLQLCVRLRELQPFSFRAVHVHHGLSQHADRWLAHCLASCEKVQVELTCLRVDARSPQGLSLEAYARQKRYEALRKILGPQDILLTAHHQDDQAETLLLQLLRGAGLKGLSAMPSVKAFGQGLLLRPFLETTGAELAVYAKAEQLVWVEDELNQDLHYPRNLLRHEILPLIKKHWPMATKTLARAAGHCAETQDLLAYFADQDLEQIRGASPSILAIKPLLKLSSARQRLVLRRWLEVQGVLMPSAVQLAELQQAVLQAREDSRPFLVSGQVELRRYQNQLYLISPLQPHDTSLVYSWNLKQALAIPGIGNLKASAQKGKGLQQEIQQVEVRFRQGGEVYRLQNGQHHPLKKFFQEQAIPSWKRDRLPLLYFKTSLVAIPGYFVSAPFQAKPEELGWVMDLCEALG